MNKPLKPTQALAHPAWLLALVVLILNDHFFKLLPEPTWLTGKISDFAGMIVAPWLLAALAGARTRRALVACHVAVGAVFGAINVWAAAAAGFEQLTALTPFVWAIYVDPTDLIALPVLVVSYRLLLPAAEASQANLRWLGRMVTIPGALACMATSEPNPPIDPPREFFSGVEAELMIGNTTNERRVVRIRGLREEVRVDCERASGSPVFAFSRALFAPATAFLIEPNQAIGVFEPSRSPDSLQPRQACRVYLIDGTDLEPRLVFWGQGDFPTQFHSGNANEVERGRLLAIRDDGRGASWDSHDALYPPPTPVDPSVQTCGVGSDASVLAFTTPVPQGPYTLTGLASSPDGCHALQIEDSALRSRRFYVCIGAADFPFSTDALIEFGSNSRGADGGAIEGLTMTSSTATLKLARGEDIVVVDEGLVASSLAPSPDCPRTRDECGSFAVPLAVELSSGGVMLPGEQANLAGGVLTLLRATEYPVVNRACHPSSGAGDRIIESVFVKVER